MSQYTTYFSSPLEVGLGSDNLAVDNQALGTIAPGNVVLYKDATILGNNGNGTATILLPRNVRLIRLTVWVFNGGVLTAGSVSVTLNGAAVSTTNLSLTSGQTEVLPTNFAVGAEISTPNDVNPVVFTTSGITSGAGTPQFSRCAVTYLFNV